MNGADLFVAKLDSGVCFVAAQLTHTHTLKQNMHTPDTHLPTHPDTHTRTAQGNCVPVIILGNLSVLDVYSSGPVAKNFVYKFSL